MILVDTSLWVDHLHRGNKNLAHLLTQGLVCMHPMVIGELTCGNLQNRAQLIDLWQSLPAAIEASHQETLYLLESHGLMGKGIGYVDLHLLAASLLSDDTVLWTRDKRLQQVAQSLGIAFSVTTR